MSTKSLADKVLRARRVAIVGASADVTKNNSRPQRYLRKHGYKGAIYPINPNYSELFGEPCFKSLKSCPEPADHAYVMVPTRAVENVVRECGEVGVAVATIFTGGFAESGADGQRAQERLLEVARESGVRLIGPNCLGIISTRVPMTLSANLVLERDAIPAGRTALISQSGSLIGSLLSRGAARGMAFSTLVSVGNEIDLGVGEIGSMLVEDPETETILLFLETLRQRDKIAAMARQAYAAGKPVIAYVLGRSELGQGLAVSHTGALIGQRAALDAYLQNLGLARIDLFENLIEAPSLFRGKKPIAQTIGEPACKPVRACVAIATTTGGGAALVADHLGAQGIDVAIPSPPLREQLAQFGLKIPPVPIVDLTMAGMREEVVDAVISGFTNDPHIDAICMVVGSSSEFHPEMAVRPLIKWAKSAKPIVAFLFPNAVRSLDMLAEAGIAAFRTPEACADALAAYLNWQAPRIQEIKPLPTRAERTIGNARMGGKPNERTALNVFASLGIPIAKYVALAPGAPTGGLGLSFPLVAKVLSSDIAHKSEVGGVVLGIESEAELTKAVARLANNAATHAAGAHIEGVLVMEQAAGIGEAIVGFRQDPVVGPTVMVGVGGILAEVYQDVAVRPAPVSLGEAREMIDAVKGLAPLKGARGHAKGDLVALAGIIAAVSQLAQDGTQSVVEAEINPVIVGREGHGAVAVDGLIVMAGQ